MKIKTVFDYDKMFKKIYGNFMISDLNNIKDF